MVVLLVSCWFLSLWNADFSCLRSVAAQGKLNLHKFIKCDAPAQTQNPGTGKETAEMFP